MLQSKFAICKHKRIIILRMIRASSFIIFDMERFYSSASRDLFNKSIDFAKFMENISDNDLKIIMNGRKTLLLHHEEPWMKKNGEEDFDVPIGYYDGAAICELAGTFILSKISPTIRYLSL